MAENQRRHTSTTGAVIATKAKVVRPRRRTGIALNRYVVTWLAAAKSCWLAWVSLAEHAASRQSVQLLVRKEGPMRRQKNNTEEEYKAAVFGDKAGEGQLAVTVCDSQGPGTGKGNESTVATSP